MTDETTTEQLAEIEGQAESTPATGYTPPEGWRVLRYGEVLQGGDEWVNWEGTVSRPDILHGDGTRASGGRYIRRIKPELQPEPKPQPVQVCEGRWRTRGGQEIPVRAMPTDHDDFSAEYPWWDGDVTTWANNGRFFWEHENAMDLDAYLGPIEPDKTQELPEYTPPDGWRVLAVGEVLQAGDMWVWPTDDQLRQTLHVGAVVGANQRYIRRIEPQPQAEPEPHAAAIEELRSEVSYVQRLLGESRQRVTQLEELVSSLRTINEGAEKAVSGAGVVNDSLRLQLAAVKAELASVAADRQQLRVELDAAQQVPADSPELRQLRADLEQATLGRDTYRDGYNRVLSDLETIMETAKAEAVEAIAEWLEPFRGCNSPALALLLLEALPAIMRSLTGLADEEIE